MQEITGDLFAHNEAGPDAICITTNGYVLAQGTNTMGAGCAGEAKHRWPGIQLIVGELVRNKGNHVHRLTYRASKLPPRIELSWMRFESWPHKMFPSHTVPYHIFSFPTKHHWADPADLKLIEKSCQQLRQHVDETGFSSVVIPRPGCGLGQLNWNEVRPICDRWLDDRFFIITFK